MATEQKVTCINMKAAADLSAKQFYLVKVDTSGNAALCTAVTDIPVGILQNTPGSLGAASVAIAGVSKCFMGSARSIGDEIASDSAGKGTVITPAAGGTTYNYAVGRCLVATAAAGGIGEVLIYGGGHMKVLV